MIDKKQIQRVRHIWARRRHWALPVAAGIFAGVVSLAVSLPKLYEARTTILIDRPAAHGGDDFGNHQYIEALLHALTRENLSRSHLEEMINTLGLYQDLRAEGVPTESVIRKLREDITIDTEEVGQGWGQATVAMNIRYVGRDPSTVADVVNELAQFYGETYSGERKRSLQATLQSLEARLRNQRAKLKNQERDVRIFMGQHADEMPEHIGVHLSTIEQLKTDLRSNRELQNEIRRQRDDLLHGAGPGGTAGSSNRLAELKHELRELRAQHTDRHPDVKTLKGRIAAYPKGEPADRRKDEAVLDVQPLLNRLDAELRELKERERVLLQEVEEREAKVRRAPVRNQELAEMLPGYETERDQYQTILQLYRDTQLALTPAGGLATNPFRILESGTAPERAFAPNRQKLALVGLIAAMMVGVGMMFLMERYDTSFHSVDDLRAFTSVPVIGVLPRIVTFRERRRTAWRFLGTVTMMLLFIALAATAAHLIADGNAELSQAMAKRF